MATALSTSQQTSRGVSVIICCYNSSQRLPDTLMHLASQIVPESLKWEIIIIDNASTDDTASVAREIWNNLIPESKLIRVFCETRAGQQFARIRGAKEAIYDLLIFCDDDNWLDQHYIFFSNECMRFNVQTGAAGGQNFPETNANGYPDWFKSFADKYALGIPAAASGDITSRGFILGAGMVTRKELFLQMFEYPYLSLLKGRDGTSLSTGDDFEYCKRLILRDWRLYYDDRLQLRHFIPKERLTISYRDRLVDGIYAAGEVIYEYDLAIRIYRRFKTKNKWRLLLLTPFRIILVRMGLMNRVLQDEQLTFFYLKPFTRGKNIVRTKIKDFVFKR